MGTWRIARVSGLRRGGSALLAGLALTTLAGVGQATAATHPGEPTVHGRQQPGSPGVISAVAGGVGGPATATLVAMSPCGVSSADGDVYIGAGSSVREMSLSSDWLTTLAGNGLLGQSGEDGLATKASMNEACAVGVDQSGDLVIADTDNKQILLVAASTGTFYGQEMTAGHIYTVAGTSKGGFSGDGGPATSAKLSYPGSVVVDSAGNLVIADSGNNRVRVVAASTGTFYGQAMTAGDIYTVAGDGTGGFSGDSGPATSAALWNPSWVAVDGAGNLVIADEFNNRVRVVAASTGTFYGQVMTAGDIYTVAGDGTAGFSGERRSGHQR